MTKIAPNRKQFVKNDDFSTNISYICNRNRYAMAILRLIDDDSDSVHFLVAIHTSLESYRLAYFLNRELEFRLQKTDDWERDDASYLCYQFTDDSDIEWRCIANKSTHHELQNTGQLFDIAPTNYLIREHKKVDFWLKALHDAPIRKAVGMSAIIGRIPQVITAYNVNFENLKSKNKLIF